VTDTTLELSFPFVEDLPKREKTRWQKVMELFDKAKQLTAEKGVLIPATLAAKLGDVSHQRICQLMEKGKLERVQLDGHIFVTEQSLIQWLKSPADKGGRPPSKPKLGEVWKMSHEWAKETVSGKSAPPE